MARLTSIEAKIDAPVIVRYKAGFFSRVLQKHSKLWMSLVLCLTDLLSLVAAFTLAISLRMSAVNVFAGLLHIEVVHIQYINLRIYQELFPLILLFLFLFGLADLYPGNGIGPVEELRRLITFTSVIFLTVSAFLFFGKAQMVYSRAIFAISWGLVSIALPLNRTLVRTIMGRLQVWGEPVAIIGRPNESLFLINHLRANYKVGLTPAMVFFTGDPDLISVGGVPILPLESVKEACNNYEIHSALVVDNSHHSPNNSLATYQEIFSRVILINTDNSEQLLWVTVQDLGGLMGYEIKHNLNNAWPRIFKRTIDVVISAGALVCLLPLFCLFFIIVKLDSTGPAFYRQKRIGKNGKEFDFIKFRTMRVDADDIIEDYLDCHPKARQEWDRYQKLRNDPRITKIGQFLRRFSIDELPQLWNVLIGEMSLVGPRPFFPSQKDDYGLSFSHYIRVRPGLTGFWQVSGRNLTTFDERVKLDDYYIRNWSIWLDLYIIVRTVWVVVRRDGAY